MNTMIIQSKPKYGDIYLSIIVFMYFSGNQVIIDKLIHARICFGGGAR